MSIILLLFALIDACPASESKTRQSLLQGYVDNPLEFNELKIGKKVVYWLNRKIGEALVEGDYIKFWFNIETGELIDADIHWRDDLEPVLPTLNIEQKEAECMIEGTVRFSWLLIISPESTTFLIKPIPKNPCWVVVSIDDKKGMLLTVIDAVEEKVLGYGAPPPYTAFSMAGPAYNTPSCDNDAKWTGLSENAKQWFNSMGYSTEGVQWPATTKEKIKSHIQSVSTAMFYEIAHCWNDGFLGMLSSWSISLARAYCAARR